MSASVSGDQRRRGLLYATIGVCCFSPDALFTRLANAERSPAVGDQAFAAPCVIVAWKALALGLFNLAAAACLERSCIRLLAGIRPAAKYMLLASLFQAVQQLGFTLSYVLTDPATALLLISLNPLWAALLGWRLLRDALPTRTIIALVLAFLAVLLVFVPILVDREAGQTLLPFDGGRLEQLRFDMPCSNVSHWARADATSWTRFLNQQPGFLRKDVLLEVATPNGTDASLIDQGCQVWSMVWWRSLSLWKAIPEAGLTEAYNTFVVDLGSATSPAPVPMPADENGLTVLLDTPSSSGAFPISSLVETEQVEPFACHAVPRFVEADSASFGPALAQSTGLLRRQILLHELANASPAMNCSVWVRTYWADGRSQVVAQTLYASAYREFVSLFGQNLSRQPASHLPAFATILLDTPLDTEGTTGGGAGPSAIAGDIIAIVTGGSVAAYITVVRRAASACPEARMSASAGIGALLASVVAFGMAAATGVRDPTAGINASAFIPLLLIDSFLLSLGYVMLTLAAGLISGTEVALVFLLQVILAPILVFIGHGPEEIKSPPMLALTPGPQACCVQLILLPL